jgi:hypothetical protein
MINFMARVDAGPGWRQVDIPFAMLGPRGKVPEGTRWNPAAVQVFGVTTPQAEAGERAGGEIAFEIDDVQFYGHGGATSQPVASGPPAGQTVVPFTALAAIPSDGWTDLANDPAGDAKIDGLPDATRLQAIEDAGGMLWVRATLRETPHDRWIGMNLALDVDDDPGNGAAWWGANSTFHFDRLVTVWCIRVAAGCQGVIGVADAKAVAAGSIVTGESRRLKFAIDRDGRAFVVGVPRELIGVRGTPIRLVAAVGSALLYADDVPGQGAATIR